MSILGAVLAGGKSSRFGSDKALALLDGHQLIEHAVASLTPFTERVVVCGREDSRWPCLPDLPVPDLGPLGGLAAALGHVRAVGYDAVLSTGCDMPVLPEPLARALIGDGAAVAEGHHLIGYWPSVLAGPLLDHLASTGDRSVRGWIAVANPRIVTVPGGALPNINRPDDLIGWATRASGGPSQLKPLILSRD